MDISKLSAKELYELARQKEQEEKHQAELDDKRNKLQQQREELVADFKRRQTELDEEIRKLQQQREQRLNDYHRQLEKLERELEALQDSGTPASPVEKPTKQQPAPAEPKPAKEQTPAPTESKPTKEQAPEPAETQSTAPAQASKPAPAKGRAGEDVEQIFKEIAELMRNREYISESLLKERLRNQGVSALSLSKALEQLVKDKRLIRKSGGSYVMGKK